jgi:hypothetical protein
MQCDDHSSKEFSQVNILTLFERFAFSILPCSVAVAREAIRMQGKQWNKTFELDELSCRDARASYDSPDGPHQLPAVQIGILLSEVTGNEGKKTLFVSSVADGYSSMIMSLSKTILGTHLSINVSRPDVAYPGNAISAVQAGKSVRTVYAMLDNDRWIFFQNGDPLPFEDIDRYRARKKRDRLTPEIISVYLDQIGYGSLRREFWVDDTAPAYVLATRAFRLWQRDQGRSA